MNRKAIDDRQKCMVQELWKDGTVIDGVNSKIYCLDITDSDFCRLLDYDLHTMANIIGDENREVKGELEYYHVEEDEGITYTLECKLYVEGILWDNISVSLTSDKDFMGFFVGWAETEDDFFDGDKEKIAEKIKSRYPEVYQHIVDNVLNNLSDYDLTDEEVEHIGETWAEDNPDEAFRIGIHNLGGYDLKEKIKDAIDEL